jgi:glycosyltransferase involved in cell wall biosynthesis
MGKSLYTKDKPIILVIGGPDVDARIELIQILSNEFTFAVAGSSLSLQSRFARNGLNFFYYPLGRNLNPFLDVCTLFSLWQLMRRLCPYIVHTFDTKPGVWGRIIARWTGVPIVIGTLPGLGALYVNDKLVTLLLRAIYQPLQMIACNLSNLTVFQNYEDAQQFIAAGVVPEQKTAVISGSGVRTDLLNPARISRNERERVRAELSIPSDALLITMVSRLIRSKGVMEFTAAAQAILNSSSKIKFLLVGSVDEESRDYLTPVELSKITHAVNWPGARNDIPTILAASDVFVFPSYYREGIPRVLLEAASMGLPIITTDLPGCKEVVEDGINGFLVPARDTNSLIHAIMLLAADTGIRREFGQKSRKKAITIFDLSVVANKTRSVYLKLLEQRSDWAYERNHRRA